jgi:hypothetical protein
MQTRALKIIQRGQMNLLMNGNGIQGVGATSLYGCQGDTFGLEYPLGTKIDLLLYGGLWIGAKVRVQEGHNAHVSSAWSMSQLSWWSEFFGVRERGDSIFHTSISEMNGRNRRGFDDDGDGRIDEDPLDGIDNDGDWLQVRDDLNHNGKPDPGEPNVDEDYGAVSESDVIILYRDSFPEPRLPFHSPLGIRVLLKSYAWKKLLKEPIIFLEHFIINNGYNTLDSVYVAYDFLTNPPTTCRELHPPDIMTYGYLPEVRTAYSYHTDASGSTPIFGVSLLGATSSFADSRITLRWEYFNPSMTDNERYTLMSSGIIDPDSSILSTGVGALLSIGPFPTMRHNDTVKFVIALVAGENIRLGQGNILDYVSRGIEVYNRNYILPSSPVSPPLKISSGDGFVSLDWTWTANSPRENPMEIWDEENNYVVALPDTHWRRRNPPPGKQKGGRVFEGFRIWRSDFPTFEEKSFALLHQFDIADDLNIGPQTGLQFTYTDSNIVRGKRYWYAVTSYSIPDYVINTYTDTSGQTVIDTLFTEAVESFLHENAVQVSIPFAPSYTAGKVKVVPNPYRTDMDYTYEGGGWEGLGRQWVEDKRVVWFIHLPPKCTIRIFTIAGEVVKTISHDDAQREANGLAVGQEEFILLSESNRALASGIYVYLVESEYGTQTGKFVVIR